MNSKATAREGHEERKGTHAWLGKVQILSPATASLYLPLGVFHPSINLFKATGHLNLSIIFF